MSADRKPEVKITIRRINEMPEEQAIEVAKYLEGKAKAIRNAKTRAKFANKYSSSFWTPGDSEILNPTERGM